MEGILAPWHWIILIAIIMLVFGPKKLPELGKGLGEGLRGFKEGMKGINGDDTEEKKKEADAKAEQDAKAALEARAYQEAKVAAEARVAAEAKLAAEQRQREEAIK